MVVKPSRRGLLGSRLETLCLIFLLVQLGAVLCSVLFPEPFVLRWRNLMNIKTLSAVAVVTAALTVPAFARYHHVQHASYHGPVYGSAYGARTFRAYARLPVDEPFFNGDGWVDHSRVGGADA